MATPTPPAPPAPSATPRTPKSSYEIVVLPGDGIGVEVSTQACALLDVVQARTGVTLNVDEIPCGGRFYLQHGSRDWPEGSEEKCRAADVILLGAVGWPAPDGSGPVTMADGKMAGYSPVIGNRMALNLYANVRPVRLLPGIRHGISGGFQQVWQPRNVDMIMVRENTEGLYSGMGGMLSTEGKHTAATDTRVITRVASERVIRRAFEISRDRGKGAPADGKKRVTCIVKNNVLYGCRLFHEVFREIGAEYPEIEKDVAIVDAFAMWVMIQPERYDVCVTTNMFGDILTDLASVLQGGMGMAVGCNLGDDHAMFEPIHGTAPPLAGKDKANPLAMLLSTGEALGWLGRRFDDERLMRAQRAIEESVAQVVSRGEPLTFDLVGPERGAPLSRVAEVVRDEVSRRLETAA
jgi:isocitrate/isopropylmalate dehydrogenase